SRIPSQIYSFDTVFFYDILLQSHSSFRAAIDTLQLGSIQVVNMDSYLQRDLNFDGIIGNDILERLIWEVDLINRKIYVYDNLNYLSDVNTDIPITLKGGHIFIELEINGIKRELMIDTGYSGFITIGRESSDSSFLTNSSVIMWEGISSRQSGNPYASLSYSPKIDSTYYFTCDVVVDNILLEDEIIELHNLPLNIVGMDFFKRFDRFVLDYRNNVVRLGNKLEKSIDYLMATLMKINTKGVTFLPSQSQAQIGRVTDWAKCVGITYLDTILSIDGEKVIDRDSMFYKNQNRFNEESQYYEYRPSKFLELWNNFHYNKDTSVIEVKRGDSSQVYTLIRQYHFTSMPDSIFDYYIDLSLPVPNINQVETASGSRYFKFKTEELLPWGLRNKEQLGLSN